MSRLLLNPQTERQLNSFYERPSHALLLTGDEGSGKYFLATHVISRLLGIDSAKLHLYPYYSYIERAEDKQNIPIESIRALIRSLNLKIPGDKKLKRAVLIKDAQHLSVEAQNALLKSLEEPPADTVFVLTAPALHDLLLTIVSRTTNIAVRPISLDSAKTAFPGAQTVESSWSLSQGNAGLLTALLSSEPHELKRAVAEAKTFLTYSPYERLIMLDRMSKDQLDTFLSGLARVIQALYKSSANSSGPRTSRLTKAMRLTLDARKDLHQNVMPRLIILKLALNLSL